jgi:hypothetical protein
MADRTGSAPRLVVDGAGGGAYVDVAHERQSGFTVRPFSGVSLHLILRAVGCHTRPTVSPDTALRRCALLGHRIALGGDGRDGLRWMPVVVVADYESRTAEARARSFLAACLTGHWPGWRIAAPSVGRLPSGGPAFGEEGTERGFWRSVGMCRFE